MADRLPSDVTAALRAISRVASALNGPGSLEQLASGALGEMTAGLSLSASALYLPLSGPRPVLTRYIEGGGDGPGARKELVFDEEAWRLAVASGHPVVFSEAAGWLVDNPFRPEADYWFALPMISSEQLVGVVMAARATPIDLDAVTLTMLRLLADQLSTGIATARLRQELLRTELERERMRLVADVHDGLAQDLALAMRELSLLESHPSDDASMMRLRAAVGDAHRLVRAQLSDLSITAPLGGLQAAVADVCTRFGRRGLPVVLDPESYDVTVSAGITATALRILGEALANAERHAAATRVSVSLAGAAESLELRIADDGRGFDPADAEASRGDDGCHLGLGLMRRRAEQSGGQLEIRTSPGGGTIVILTIPRVPA